MGYILIFQILAKHHEQRAQLWVLDDIDGLVNLLVKFKNYACGTPDIHTWSSATINSIIASTNAS
jgi:hypothetical protein